MRSSKLASPDQVAKHLAAHYPSLYVDAEHALISLLTLSGSGHFWHRGCLVGPDYSDLTPGMAKPPCWGDQEDPQYRKHLALSHLTDYSHLAGMPPKLDPDWAAAARLVAEAVLRLPDDFREAEVSMDLSPAFAEIVGELARDIFPPTDGLVLRENSEDVAAAKQAAQKVMLHPQVAACLPEKARALAASLK